MSTVAFRQYTPRARINGSDSILILFSDSVASAFFYTECTVQRDRTTEMESKLLQYGPKVLHVSKKGLCNSMPQCIRSTITQLAPTQVLTFS